MEAALKGSREIGFTILSMTLSLVAVFIPVLFMGGILGRILHEFAVTISFAILISGLVSLTLTPMLSSRFIKPPSSARHGRLYLAMERFFDGMLHLYERTLTIVMRHRRLTMAVVMALTVATGFLFVKMPTGFLPVEDTGQIFAFTEAAQGISFDDMVKHQRELAAIVAEDPNVDAFMSAVGASGISVANNAGRIFMRLKPRHERKLSADEIIQELRPKVAKVPGIRMFMQNLPAIRIGGTLTKSQYQFTLQSPDTEELYRSAVDFETKLKTIPTIPQLQEVTSDLQIKSPQVNVQIDRDRASALGLSAQQIEDALYYAYGSRQVSTIYAPNNQYQVILELDPRYQMDPSSLSLLYVRADTGSLVPLDTAARLTRSLGPLTVNHLGQLPAVTISFDTKPGVALSDAVALVQKNARETLPQSVTTSFQGSAQAFQSSMKGLWVLLVMAILSTPSPSSPVFLPRGLARS
jgi:HAE1 family hydrophobic/amphiphilic exporter-1